MARMTGLIQAGPVFEGLQRRDQQQAEEPQNEGPAGMGTARGLKASWGLAAFRVTTGHLVGVDPGYRVLPNRTTTWGSAAVASKQAILPALGRQPSSDGATQRHRTSRWPGSRD